MAHCGTKIANDAACNHIDKQSSEGTAARSPSQRRRIDGRTAQQEDEHASHTQLDAHSCKLCCDAQISFEKKRRKEKNEFKGAAQVQEDPKHTRFRLLLLFLASLTYSITSFVKDLASRLIGTIWTACGRKRCSKSASMDHSTWKLHALHTSD